MNTLILDQTENGEVPIDIFAKLAQDRILFLDGYLDDELAVDLAATIFLLDCQDSDELITLMINAEGGQQRAMFLLFDAMMLCSAPIKTVCIGAAMGEIALILAAGEKGLRYATQSSVICVGQLVREEFQRATLTDAKSIAKRIEQDNKSFLTAMAKHTGKKMTELKALTEKVFLTPKQAISFGLIDNLIRSSK